MANLPPDHRSKIEIILQLWVQVIHMSLCYTPLWKRGVRGDFPNIILKSPSIPLCPPGQRPLWVGDQRGIKTTITEALRSKIEIP
jgi:hypothetical protein